MEEGLKDTTARLRRTFRYPTDDDDDEPDGAPEAIDEEGPTTFFFLSLPVIPRPFPPSSPRKKESFLAPLFPKLSLTWTFLEQEKLIGSLTAENRLRNGQARWLLVVLPLACTLPYLARLFFFGPPRRAVFSSLLGLSSLASTAYLVHALPPMRTGLAPLDRWARSSGGGSGSQDDDDDDDGKGGDDGDNNSNAGRPPTWSVVPPAYRGPLESHLPTLNAALCVLLAVLEWVSGSGRGRAVVVGLGYLPALVYGVVLAAKVVMAGVDPERELGGLRYEFKGA